MSITLPKTPIAYKDKQKMMLGFFPLTSSIDQSPLSILVLVFCETMFVFHRLLGEEEETRKFHDTLVWSAHQTRDLSRIGEGA